LLKDDRPKSAFRQKFESIAIDTVKEELGVAWALSKAIVSQWEFVSIH
jgi:hypothetical protein